MIETRFAMYASGLLQVAQRRFLLDREAAKAWGLRFLATDQDSLASVRAVIAASDEPVAAELAELLPPSDAPIGDWTPCARLGLGPLGSTWLAFRGTDLAAIKILGLDPSTATARATAQGALDLRKATHVVKPLTVVDDGPALAVVSPYVPGRDLAGWMRVRGIAAEPRALRLARQAAKGLLRIHRAGGVHGDLRPGNVLVGTDGRALLAHHQLAVHAGRYAAGFDPASDGGQAWLAPELAAGGAPSELGDCYALACALYQLLAGELPFPGEPARQTLQHAKASRPDVRQRAPGVSELTAKTIARAMAIEPDQRFRSSEQFLRALMSCAEQPDRRAHEDPADDNAATIAGGGSSVLEAPADLFVDDEVTIDAPADLFVDDAEDTIATALPDGPAQDPAGMRSGATAISQPRTETDEHLSLTDSFLLDEPE